LLVSVSLILLVGLPCSTTFLLVSLEDKLMPRKRERVSHVGNAECLTQSPVLNSEAEKLQLVSSNWYYNYKRSMQNWGKTF
jgi:tRNA wybutosine-synthesizing protein 3